MTEHVDTATPRADAFAVTVDDGMRVREGEWDGARGEREIFDWATRPDGTVDWAKASRGFGVADLDKPDDEITRDDFKLAVAYVEDGELVAIGNAIRNALARLSQTQGLSDAVRGEVQAKFEAMLARLNEQTDASPPVDAEPQPAQASASTEATQASDASERVIRTCTLDFTLDAETRVAIDRALEIVAELGTRTDAVQANALAERLRSDGFADKVSTDGRLIVTGYAARTGSQLYGDGKRTWYEYRSEAEVEKSLAGYDDKTFTDDHPPVLVTADNWREYARGHLGTGAILLPPADDGFRYVKVKICVGDIATIRKMRDGKVELSAGYTTVAVRDPGIDAQGVRYTYRQTDIIINHLALVDQGRAGPRARIQIDGATVFEIVEETDTIMTTNDQMTPEAAMALLDAIKGYAYAESQEAADAAMQAIAMALELDVEMVKQHLGNGGEMMEMDGVLMLVSKDAAAKIRAREQRVHGDTAKVSNDLAAARGELSALKRTVDSLMADKAATDMRELEREIAPVCPQLVKAWTGDSKTRPTTLTEMRVAAIMDLDSEAKTEIDSERGPDPKEPASTFDSFVAALYRSTLRQAKARSTSAPAPTNDHHTPPMPKIDTSGIYGKRTSAASN